MCLFDIESAPCRSTQSYVWSPLKEVFCVQICSMSSHLCFVSIYLKYLSDIFFPPGIQVTSDLPYFHSAPTLALSKCHSLPTTKAGNWKIKLKSCISRKNGLRSFLRVTLQCFRDRRRFLRIPRDFYRHCHRLTICFIYCLYLIWQSDAIIQRTLIVMGNQK